MKKHLLLILALLMALCILFVSCDRSIFGDPSESDDYDEEEEEEEEEEESSDNSDPLWEYIKNPDNSYSIVCKDKNVKNLTKLPTIYQGRLVTGLADSAFE